MPQVKQLTKLIEVTRTDLSKPSRQKIMNMITIDAHSRDMVLVSGQRQRCRIYGMLQWHGQPLTDPSGTFPLFPKFSRRVRV